MSTYAIGDIHGRYDLLADLLDRIGGDDWRRKHREETCLVLLGDYVDRVAPARRPARALVVRL